MTFVIALECLLNPSEEGGASCLPPARAEQKGQNEETAWVPLRKEEGLCGAAVEGMCPEEARLGSVAGNLTVNENPFRLELLQWGLPWGPSPASLG